MSIPTSPSAQIRNGIYGVLGQGISYSLSPLIFRRVFDDLGWSAVYGLFDMPPSRLRRFTAAARHAGIEGFNVTRPYKTSIMRYLDRLDPAAAAVNAVNTVVVKKDRLVGYNTDPDGVFHALKPVGRSLNGGRAVVLGAGGAARAIAYTLASRLQMRDITIVARSPAKGRHLLRQMQLQFGERCKWRCCTFEPRKLRQALDDTDLLVNATPVGGPGSEKRSPLPVGVDLSTCRIIFDLVYNPRPSRLLKQAADAGCRTMIDGWGMLIAQAEAAFTLWTNRTFPPRVRRELLKWNGK